MEVKSKNILHYMALFIAFIGLVFFAIGGWALWEEISSTHWPSTQGTILQSEIIRWSKKKSSYDYRAKFSYQYQVGGKSYTGDRISTARNRYKSQMSGQAALTPYPVGKTVQVYYNPTQPERALLEPGWRIGTIFKTVLGFLLLLGGLSFVVLRTTLRRNA